MNPEKTLELLSDDLEQLDRGLENLDNYVNEMELRHIHRIEALEKRVNNLDVSDHRISTLEKEFNKMNEVQQLLTVIKKELGLDEKQFEKVQSAVRAGGIDLDEGGH